MFEGIIPSVSPPRPAERGALNAVAWSDLVAKLAAARDFRAVVGGDRRGSFASFAPRAAQALAAQDFGKDGINPDALGGSKAPHAKTLAAADDAGHCDREIR